MEPTIPEYRYYELPDPERQQVLATLQKALEGRDEILFAYAHGSFTMGLPFRDIDIGVYLTDDFLAQEDLLDYEIDMGLMLTDLVRFPVDVRVINKAPLPFQFNVTAGQLLVSRDDEFRLRYVERIRMEYYDFEPVARRLLREVLE